MSKTVKPTFRTESDIARLPVPEKPFDEYWHAGQKGFGVRVSRPHSRTGVIKRTYIVRLPEGSGKSKDNLGEVGNISFDEAWDLVREKRAEAKRDGPESKRKPTLQEAFDAYMVARRHKHSDATVVDYRNKMRRLASLTHGPKDISIVDMRVDEMDTEFWERIHVRIREGYGTTMAHAACRLAKFVYQRLVDNHELDRNPVIALNKLGISLRAEPKQTAVIPQDLPEVWTWMHSYAHPVVRDYMLIELFMGFRDGVVQRFRWENVDIPSKQYFLPKTEPGNKSKKDVWVPIPDYIMENVILPRWAARQDNCPWVLPSSKKEGEPLVSIKGSLTRMCAMLGIQTSPHDYRRTFGTSAELALGNTLRVSRLLSHSVKARGNENATTAGYVNHTLETMREDMNRTAAVILQLATQPIQKPDASGHLTMHDRAKLKHKADAAAYLRQRVKRNTELLGIRKAKAQAETK
ncbi:hypothetical protein QZM42_05595 [Burkholderia vietnamiensis]|uniref:tyrosine-type recombinase/integrase n=1 Tax=Burkholderia vietnamiensis TaxID=60552 RepID=UPI00264DA48B|nr:hypothetical protein [Burkholderia vietnamiensis]MDN7408019.1 hypothetical protein [Burkholderia vietnamiensis]